MTANEYKRMIVDEKIHFSLTFCDERRIIIQYLKKDGE